VWCDHARRPQLAAVPLRALDQAPVELGVVGEHGANTPGRRRGRQSCGDTPFSHRSTIWRRTSSRSAMDDGVVISISTSPHMDSVNGCSDPSDAHSSRAIATCGGAWIPILTEPRLDSTTVITMSSWMTILSPSLRVMTSIHASLSCTQTIREGVLGSSHTNA